MRLLLLSSMHRTIIVTIAALASLGGCGDGASAGAHRVSSQARTHDQICIGRP